MAFVLSLPGCAMLGGKEPPTAFDLTAPQRTAHLGAIKGQLVIPEPTSVSVLDGDRIVVRPTPEQVATLGGVQWSDRLPKLVQARILQAFENSGRSRAVGRPGEGISADYQLLLDVRAFQLVVDPAPAGVVEIAAKVVDTSGHIVAGRVFRATSPAASTEGAKAVAAVDAAFQDVTVQLMRWVTRVI